MWKINKYGKKIVLFTLVIMNFVDQPAPEVIIVQGILSGKISADGTTFEYVGIPYATSNSSTRFQAPGPPPSWEGVYRAVDEIYGCPQNTFFGVIGSEDCLKINVYVPAIPKSKPHAVMAYIHGGSFILGNGGKLIYGPGYLVRKDVIVVTFNYRLGPLGFLCLRIKEAPGNAGLKDQIAALKWIQKNIAAFGGDPDKVTVFGESAGATSVSLLLASEASTGLFKRAIVQSGSSLSNWAINRKPELVASHIVKSFGYNTEDPKELYEIFSKMSYKEITSINAKKPLDLFFKTQILLLPCVESKIPGIEPILTDLPYNIISQKPKNVDVVYGITSNEGLIVIAEENEKSIRERNVRYLLGSDLNFPTENEAREIANKIHEFYFGKDEISLEKFVNITNLYSHLYFEMPAIFEAQQFVKNGKSKVYTYVFDYSGSRNVLKFHSTYWNENGASHGDDLFYIFNGNLCPFTLNSRDKIIIDYMTSFWTNFAKYGNPTPDESNLPIKWHPNTKDNLNFLYINSKLRMDSMPSPEAYWLWKEIYDKYRNFEI
ncbi:esterase FE4-like [Vanessa atalanta]|uniref:esterase FE4-like n=1 Tax=Vanessa atalanta TaxID=42275 RepID=UPI001FCE28B8|nr:esterase FE4-like [Vanessa atalanta]